MTTSEKRRYMLGVLRHTPFEAVDLLTAYEQMAGVDRRLVMGIFVKCAGEPVETARLLAHIWNVERVAKEAK